MEAEALPRRRSGLRTKSGYSSATASRTSGASAAAARWQTSGGAPSSWKRCCSAGRAHEEDPTVAVGGLGAAGEVGSEMLRSGSGCFGASKAGLLHGG